jgi:hypothetical protein
MRVSFVTSSGECDYLSACLWDGLQEVLGEENIIDAINASWLHKSDIEPDGVREAAVAAISGTRNGIRWPTGKYDLIIFNACFNRKKNVDWSWTWAKEWQRNLSKGGKVAFVEGWDAAWQITRPKIHVDAYFRKEISGKVTYPMKPHHLNFAAPSRWFAESSSRPIDLFFVGDPATCLPGHEVRWPMLRNVFRTAKKHRSVIATCGLGLGQDEYLAMLRRAKFALCPSAADLADSLRTFEAAACGTIPIFVGYPDHVRDPWFPAELIVNCTADTLPEHIDEALAHDATAKSRALQEYAREYHTTAARAKQLLKVMGMEA